MRSYIGFCRLHNIPERPSADSISFYIVWARGEGISPRSVEGYLSGVFWYWEIFDAAVRSIREHIKVSRTLAGCHKMYAQPTKRKRALGRSDLFLLRVRLDLTLYDDLLFWSITMLGWYGLHRLGELVDPDSTALRAPRKRILRASVTQSPSHLSYHLPYHKADRLFGGNTCMIERQVSSLCPMDAVNKYLALRDLYHPAVPALFLTASGSVLQRSWYIRRLREHFKSVAGHSLRSGGATYLAKLGTDNNTIRMLGRWSSLAFELYIRDHPILIYTSVHGRSLFS